jgi:hypothetical protein
MCGLMPDFGAIRSLRSLGITDRLRVRMATVAGRA